MKRSALSLFTMVAVCVIGSGAYLWNTKTRAEESTKTPPPDIVDVVTITPQTIFPTQELPGRVTPYRQAQVRPQVDGIITRRLFEEGSFVEKGEQLYQIDDARYAAILKGAQAELESAQANVTAVAARARRAEQLIKADAVSRQTYDDIKAERDQANAAVSVAQAAVDIAELNLGYTKVYAPIAGHIGKSFVTEGALVTASQSQHLAIITQLDPVYVDLQQSGPGLAGLRNDLRSGKEIPVRLIADDGTASDHPHEGRLKFSEVTVNETTDSIPLRALMSNPDGDLLPGLFVRARIERGETQALLLPQRAAMRTPDGNLTVWVIDAENKAQKRSVTVSRDYGENWIVTDGLKAGDRVVVSGYLRLAPGTPVQPQPWHEKTD